MKPDLLTAAKAIDKLLQQWIGDYGPVALAQIKEFRAAIADAEKQEPVAWIDPAFRNGREDRLIYIPRSDGTSVPLYLHPTAPTVPEGWQPIETAPTDSQRLDYLGWLMTRTEFQNSRRPEEPVSSDMHFMYGECVLYVRSLTGRVAASGGGSTVRDAIDKCMATLPQPPKEKP